MSWFTRVQVTWHSFILYSNNLEMFYCWSTFGELLRKKSGRTLLRPLRKFSWHSYQLDGKLGQGWELPHALPQTSSLSLMDMICNLNTVTQKARLSHMSLEESRGKSEIPVPLTQDSIILTSWRNKTGINKGPEFGLLKTKNTNIGRRVET